MPLDRPIPRIKVINYGKLGELMIRWATEPETRPENLEVFKRAVEGAIDVQNFPTWVKGLQFVQSNNEVLMIRLPPAEFIEDTLERIEAGAGKYPFPDFYERFILEPGPHDQKEIFRFRVGDYTIAHCI
ncbi:MAG: hypothetical protein HC869_03290 [Rhodospirillales bacterium]|nr:hypothetical protein [Rhodospirillales bacterium]